MYTSILSRPLRTGNDCRYIEVRSYSQSHDSHNDVVHGGKKVPRSAFAQPTFKVKRGGRQHDVYLITRDAFQKIASHAEAFIQMANDRFDRRP